MLYTDASRWLFGRYRGHNGNAMQSHEGYIELLPALPTEWNEGEMKGVRARGGFELDFSWRNGALSSLEVVSKAGMPFKMKSKNKLTVFSEVKPIKVVRRSRDVFEFKTVKGSVYSVMGV